MDKLKIFISGTQDDMQPERDAVDRAVNSTTLSAAIRAETAVSQPESSRAWIEQQLHECNIYIGVYSHRYGWVIPEENISATEFEFNLARQLQRKILIWIRNIQEDEKGQPNFDRQEQFIKRVSDFSTGFLRQTFDNPADLEKQVAAGLGEAFTEMIRSSHAPIPFPRLVPLDIPSWFQSPSLRTMDASLSSSQKIQLDALVSDLAIEKTKRLAIVGKSGCGKSATMAAIMRSLSTHGGQGIYYVYVPLGDYSQSLASTIKNNIGWQDVPDSRVATELAKLGVVLLLDGLNEVPGTQREQCRNEIKSLMHSYQGGIVVSFPSVDRVYFGFGYPAYEILPLEAQQIRQIITNYFSSKGEEKQAEWFLERFASRGDFTTEFLQLAELPLNLQFLLELGSEVQFDVRSIRDLYGEVMERRFNQLERQEKKGKFPTDVKKECLADLAIQSLVDDSGVRMSKTFVRTVFSRKLSTVETSEILSEIIRSGLLNDIGDQVQWFHASLRDYLAGYRLYTLADSGSLLDGFPIEKPQWNGAVAYAVGLSTMPIENQSIGDLLKRPTIFNEFLLRKPASELVRSVVQEYHPAHLVGDGLDRKGTETDFLTLQWGERFLIAYKQIGFILQQENREIGGRLPNPNGLKVFTSPSGRFCAMVLSDETGIKFDDLSRFDDQVVQSNKKGKSCEGFCLHGYLLPTVDPEMVAFSQVIVWLNFSSRKDSEQYQDWLRDIASFSVFTPNEWVDWHPQRTINVAHNSGWQSDKLQFTWQEFYAPLTFYIDPVITPSKISPIATRSGSLSFARRSPSQISLIFLLSGSPKTLSVDLGTRVYIPMPPITLNREYFTDGMSMSYTQGGPFISFVHLRG